MSIVLKTDKAAAAYAVQIKETHNELIEVEAKGFQHSLALAIELGVLLNQAKATVGHGHFEKWFVSQEFKFAFRTAQRYMRLADNRETLEEKAKAPRETLLEAELSIRGADALLKEK